MRQRAIASKGIASLLLAISAGASAWLVMERAFALPGCGVGSGCARLASSPLGRVPGLGWPISAVGFAWFVGLLAGWAFAGGTAWVRWAARAGAGVSLVYVASMIAMRGWCPFCAAAHAGSLGFWILIERTGRVKSHGLAGALVAIAASTAAMIGAWGVLAFGAGQRASIAERELAETRRRIEGAPEPARVRFTGRYHWGPADARARIVVFTDYQCPDCRRIEAEIEAAFEADPARVSVSVKHFPFCADCNPHVPSSLHPNACWAARAAEAGGLLAGDEGFRRVHAWLFERGGAFTASELRAALPGLGFDPGAFEPAMASGDVSARIKADVDEAVALGIHFTPMVFVNGVEVRGWQVRGAIARAVASAIDAGGRAGSDEPPPAIEKAIEDWREQPARELTPIRADRTWGQVGAPARVLIFGDYQEPFTARADAIARGLAGADVAYEFRHFPVDPACNPAAPRAMHSLACEAATLVESAGSPAARRAAHEALMALNGELGADEIEAIRARLGIERADSAWASIRRDADEAGRLGVASLPMIFVNERWLPRFLLSDGEEVLTRVVEEASAR